VVPAHAAGVQADVAAVGGQLHPVAVQRGGWATATVDLLGWFPRLKRFGAAVGALFGGPMATYTAVQLANTAVPSWHELPVIGRGSTQDSGPQRDFKVPQPDLSLADRGRRTQWLGSCLRLARRRSGAGHPVRAHSDMRHSGHTRRVGRRCLRRVVST
jgi:hypothetical protein